METIRVFIAVELTQNIQKNISQITEKLSSKENKITWIESKNIHLTMRFLGDTSIEKIKIIKDAILDTAKMRSKFDIEIKEAGVFPNERKPHVIWAGVKKGEEELKLLYSDLESNLNSIGIEKENREFVPHITFGRIKFIKNVKNFIEKIKEINNNLFGNMTVDGISLIKSTLTPKGSIYEVLYKAKLKQ